VNARFALRLSLVEAACLGAVRRWPGLEVCEAGQSVWLRSQHLDDEQWDFCRRLPGADRYTLTDDGRLLAVGMLVPHGRPPDGPWRVVADWLAVELPPTDSAPAPPKRAALGLVRSSVERDPSWLLTDIDTWAAYAATAPQVRLACWTFVVNPIREVLVRGTPLPPLAGTQLVETEGIAVPVGFAWSPAVPPAVIRKSFRLEIGDSLVWSADGTARRIPAGDWVRATRSAVRLTRDQFQNGGPKADDAAVDGSTDDRSADDGGFRGESP
jgi:hypothetical protein